MGTYTFKWPSGGETVFVTGTFDDWSKSVQLEKVAGVFEKTIELPDTSDKIYYKFVVDGEWTVNKDAPKEVDPSGIENNFLTVEDIVKSAPPEAALISSVGPEATTIALAKDAPLEEKEKKEDSAESAADMDKEDKQGSPVPGAFPETPAAELDKEVKINPLPASDGPLNPIKLAPGEKIPESITSQDINKNVKLDPESYEKADTLPGVSDIADLLPPVSSNMIPESSLPITGANDVTINTVGPNATTLGLAADAPLEPKAPAIVKESQEKAGFDPEASAISEEIKEKGQVEAELLEKVPEAPSTSEGTAGKGTEKSEADKTIAETVTATAAGLSGAAVASAIAAKDAVVEQAAAAAAQLPDSVKQNLPESVQDAIAPAAQEEIRQEVSPEVPTEVKESIKEAGESPEAAANTAAVEEKKTVEAELLKEVKAAPAVDEEPKPAEDKKAEEAAETKKAEEAAETKKAEEATPEDKPAAAANGASAEPSTAAVKETTPETPAKKADVPTTAVANGDSPATAEKKKKNRLSSMFSKIKHKVSSSHK